MSSPVSTFRYFEQDLDRKTVRCNLSRLAEETDHDLVRAAVEYLEEGLEDGRDLLRGAARPRPLPRREEAARRGAADRKTVPWTDGGTDADDLASVARALLAR